MLKKTTFEKRDDGVYYNLEPLLDFSYQGCIDQRNDLDKKFYKQRERIVHETFKEVLSPLLDNCSNSNQPIRILDVGCGDGALLKAFHELAKKKHLSVQLVGLDIDPIAMKHMRFPVKKVVASATSMPFPDNSFDVVTCSQTIEHVTLQDAKKMIREIFRVLSPMGQCFIETPNPESMVAKAMAGEWWMYIDLHLILLSPDILARMLKRAGFIEVVGTTRDEHDAQMDEAQEVMRRLKMPKASYSAVRTLMARLQLGGITLATGIKPNPSPYPLILKKIARVLKKVL